MLVLLCIFIDINNPQFTYENRTLMFIRNFSLKALETCLKYKIKIKRFQSSIYKPYPNKMVNLVRRTRLHDIVFDKEIKKRELAEGSLK